MGEKIRVDLEELAEGGTFDSDELIVSLNGDRMETVRQDQAGEDEIEFFAYDIIGSDHVRYNGGCEIHPGEPSYDRYHSMLMEAKLWQ